MLVKGREVDMVLALIDARGPTFDINLFSFCFYDEIILYATPLI